MKIHLQPDNAHGLRFIGRGYTLGSYEEKSPYDLVFSLFIAEDHDAFIHAMHGDFTLETMFSIARELEKLGVENVTAFRNGRTSYYKVSKVLSRVARRTDEL